MPASHATPWATSPFQPLPLRIAAAFLALVLPSLLLVQVPPSPTFFNQAAALIGWSVFLGAVARSAVWPLIASRTGLAALLLAVALYAGAACASMAWAKLPASLAWPSLAVMSAAAVAVLVGAGAAQAGRVDDAFHAMCVAIVVAGVLSASIGLIQVFMPELADGVWISPTSSEGRATGNLRQPNHLSSLLLWSMIAAIWLADSGRLARLWGVTLSLVFLFALVLASSRTGVVGVLLMSLWGMLDRRHSRHARLILVLAPVIYAAFFGALALWAEVTGHFFAGEARISDTAESPNSRWRIWSNTMALIAAHPWTGVGFGEFNFAWSLTPFPSRPTAFFDHTHNLPLHLAVELGLPLATLILSLLCWAVWKAFASGRDVDVPHTAARRAAFMMVLMVGLHSLLEYPLWYAYFLLPTAFALGLCLAGDDVKPEHPASLPGQQGVRPLLLSCIVMLGGTTVAVVDYLRVARIFMTDDGLPALQQRIAIGQRSTFFAHHAHYAAATTNEHPSRVLGSFRSASHFLLDTRLLTAWSVALFEAGDVERARYVAQRLREFRNDDAKSFFVPCDDPAQAAGPRPYQCTLPSRRFDYRDFR